MDRYFISGIIHPFMVTDIRFLNIKLRAIAQATEVQDRVLKAMVFASCIEAVIITKMQGHFGNPIIVFEAELKKTADIRRFIDSFAQTAIFSELADQVDARTDESCVFHFRLDKQKSYLGELALATDHDVIDVKMKVAVYPARREDAVSQVSSWLASFSQQD